MLSQFDKFGGYYSVLQDDVEMARFAPSNFWSDAIQVLMDMPEVTYIWVSTNDEDGA